MRTREERKKEKENLVKLHKFQEERILGSEEPPLTRTVDGVTFTKEDRRSINDFEAEYEGYTKSFDISTNSDNETVFRASYSFNDVFDTLEEVAAFMKKQAAKDKKYTQRREQARESVFASWTRKDTQ